MTAAQSKCAVCGKPQNPQFRPFCSKRCADVDLNRWLSGGYAIPAAEEDDGEQSANGE
ncbi:MAG: DNA gyrase inhibitor YacG [Vitreimonas sp.]